jgi:hypothetical protein
MIELKLAANPAEMKMACDVATVIKMNDTKKVEIMNPRPISIEIRDNSIFLLRKSNCIHKMNLPKRFRPKNNNKLNANTPIWVGMPIMVIIG